MDITYILTDLPTFYEIKADDISSSFLQKNAEDFYATENIAILYLPVKQNKPIFPF